MYILQHNFQTALLNGSMLVYARQDAGLLSFMHLFRDLLRKKKTKKQLDLFSLQHCATIIIVMLDKALPLLLSIVSCH